jgi:hypothetical protein
VLSTTATERVVNSVHRHTAHTRVFGPTGSHLVVFIPGLDERFLCPPTAGDDPNRCPAIGR